MLVKHVRQDGRLVGTVVALDRNIVGWSQCCPKDRFIKQLGVKIAEGRALKGTKKQFASKTALAMHNAMVEMKERSEKYFK
jgi:hypothetical protein